MKTSILFTLIFSFIFISSASAELQVMTKQEMMENSEAIASQKIYFRYESKYTPVTKDISLLKKLDKKLKLIHSKKPKALRKLHTKILKKLKSLAQPKRTSSGNVVHKKDTKLYYLLEQINNKISDQVGNQDLGCQKGLAHMENKTCVDNTKNISDTSGNGYQKYDFINENWGPIKMMRCNSWYNKQEQISRAVSCVRN